MPPIVNPAATIPYEIASDIEYAERRMNSFDKWAFKDGQRARRSVHDAVAAYGRVWGKLRGEQPFWLDNCRPYSVQIGPWGPEMLFDDPVLEKADEVATALADIEENPLIYSPGMDKEVLHRELARKNALKQLVQELGDLVRDLIQHDYVHLQPGDWVRVPFRNVAGRVAAVNHARARVTTAEQLSKANRTQLSTYYLDHLYTSCDLVRDTLERIPAPNPLPLAVPGLEWFAMAVEAQRSFDFFYERKSSNLFEQHKCVQMFEYAIEELFLSEQPSELMTAGCARRNTFPEEYSAYFPDWIEGRLRTHYKLAGELSDTLRMINQPPCIHPLSVVTALVDLGREMTDLLAYHIADQVGCEPGAQLLVFGDYTIRVPDDEIEEGVNDFFGPQPRRATLVKQTGRTLTVEFDADEELPGLHEVDISDVKS